MSEFIDSNGAKVGDDDASEEEVDQVVCMCMWL